jgi:deoxyadenosine/deoxycytidine kinase
MFYRDILNNLNKGKFYDSIVIEGCSGCGKSTLMELLSNHDNKYTKFTESVEDNPIIDKYFHDRKKYSFALQVFFLNRKFEEMKIIEKSSKTLLDRSIYCNVVFAKMYNETDEMTKEEFNVYLELFKNILSFHYPPKLMIHLESSTDGIVERIQRRGRDYEKLVNRDYWDHLNNSYIDFFSQYNLSPVLKINVDKYNFADNRNDKKYITDLIQETIRKIDENNLVNI